MQTPKIVMSAISEVLKDKPNATVLDIGAGSGYMHTWVSEAGYNYFAIDTDTKVKVQLEEKGVPVIDYADISRLGISVDVVILGNMYDILPLSVLAKSQSQLKGLPAVTWENYEDGTFLLSVANVE